MLEWIQSAWWLIPLSVVMLLASPLVVGWVVVRLPADYFMPDRRRGPKAFISRPWIRLAYVVLKNLLGAFLIIAGLVMLLSPGQGLLTIFIGLMLTNFPGKYHLERWIVSREPVLRSINWLREKADKEPLRQPA